MTKVAIRMHCCYNHYPDSSAYCGGFKYSLYSSVEAHASFRNARSRRAYRQRGQQHKVHLSGSCSHIIKQYIRSSNPQRGGKSAT